ncbi:MAG: RNA polymerase sigma factor [Ruminococcus sp.]|nr:RNA polymerase sigma factor [Ruminococcus sp.]
MTDERIIELLFGRSEEGLRGLRESFGGLVRRVAAAITGDSDRIDEIENDTMLAVWQRIPPERPDPLGAYVCAIARNLALKQRREQLAQKRGFGRSVPLEELDTALGSEELMKQLSARELGREINRFLDTLGPRERALFVRRYYLEQSVEEAARALGLRPNTAAVKLLRLRRALREHLEKEGYKL